MLMLAFFQKLQNITNGFNISITSFQSIYMTYRGVEICFARSCKHQQNRVAFFPVFSCLRVYTNRIYGHRVI